MARAWHITGWREYALVDTTGKVLGTVRDSSSYAKAFAPTFIGDYLNVEYAKVAVEKALGGTPE